nr:unnamed protein product [Callosobruchus chinensis]
MEQRVSTTQLEGLIQFLEGHPQLAKGAIGFGGRSKETIDRKWEEVADVLNAPPAGAHKTGERWKRYWIDLKYRVKTRAARIREDATRTGGGPPSVEDLSAWDKRVLAILGEKAVVGDREHRVPLFVSS